MTGKQTRIHADWLDAPDTRAVMAALRNGGGESRFVGGCVRNALMGLAATDIDLATTLLPETAMKLLEDAGLHVIAIGLQHGTITTVSGGKSFEVTTLRLDVATDGRHAEVAFTDDWAADAGRRDFTMNALYADADGTLFDPLGRIGDALSGNVCFVGDADARITEDYLRILRFFRFQAWYGQGDPDPAGLAACGRHLAGLERLSAERVGSEMMKLMAADDPHGAMSAMAASGVLAAVLAEAFDLSTLDRVIDVEGALGFNPGPLRRLAALTANRTAALRDRFRLSNNQSVHLAGLAALAPLIRPEMGERDAHALIYKNGRAVWRDSVIAAWSRSGDGPATETWRRLADLSSWEAPMFPITGKDLIARGHAPGKEIGAILKDLERRWMDSDFQLEAGDLLP